MAVWCLCDVYFICQNPQYDDLHVLNLFPTHLPSCVPNCVSDIFDDAALFICHYCLWCCILSFSEYSTNLTLFGPCDGKHISSMPILFASKNLFIGCGSTCAYITAAWLFNSQCWLAYKRLMATIKMFKISNILGVYKLNTFSPCPIQSLCLCVHWMHKPMRVDWQWW